MLVLVTFEIGLDASNIELGERENLGEFAIFEVSLFPNLFGIDVNYVASLINKIAFVIDKSAQVVE